MGLDLTLMPLSNARDLQGFSIARATLDFVRDNRIFGQIATSTREAIEEARTDGFDVVVQPKIVPRTFKIQVYIGDTVRTTRKSGLDGEMVYATAGELRKIKLPEGTSHFNKAAMSYVRALQKDIPVIIYWR